MTGTGSDSLDNAISGLIMRGQLIKRSQGRARGQVADVTGMSWSLGPTACATLVRPSLVLQTKYCHGSK